MFADELAVNASRKKQEQAKARRRKLLDEQNKKKVINHGKTSIDETNKVEATYYNAKGDDRKNTLPIEVVKKDFHAGIKTNKSIAVDRALEQRKVRNTQKMNNTAAEKIQSTFRAYASNQRLLREQKTILKKRLGDLVAVSQLFAKQNNDFCPPPSLVNVLLNQMLFVVHSRPKMQKNRNKESAANDIQYFSKISEDLTNSDVKVISQVIEFGLIPGLLAPDTNLNPALVWLQSGAGKMKFFKLLRLCIYLILARQQKSPKRSDLTIPNSFSPLLAFEDDLQVIYKMILILMGNESTGQTSKHEIAAFCQSIFLSSNPRIVQHPITIGKKPLSEENLDLISLLRTFLLFPSGMKINVIPRNADSLRENSISVHDRQRADGFYNIVSKVLIDNNNVTISSRMLAEIFTVPLLTWRLEQKTLGVLVGKLNRDKEQSNPTFITFMNAFLEFHKKNNLHQIEMMLPSDDVPLTICPSPSILSLCANLSQMGAMCPSISDIDTILFNMDVVTIYFKFMSLLVENIPLGSYSSRESDVGWVQEGSHLSPIIISSTVRDQCKILLAESFIRKLFHVAIDCNHIDHDNILNRKDERDRKMEEEVMKIQSESAISVAAKEAMKDHTAGFWQKSKWAKKLSKRVTSLLVKNKSSEQSNGSDKEALPNISKLSRDLASGEKNAKSLELSHRASTNFMPSDDSDGARREEFLFCLVRTYAIIVSRWGGNAREIIDLSAATSTVKATEHIESSITPLLNVLCFSTSFLKACWALLQTNQILINDLHELVDVKKRPVPIRMTGLHSTFINGKINFTENIGCAFLVLLLGSLAHSLVVTDDIELHDLESPLPKHQIRRCVLLLKSILYRACCLDIDYKSSQESTHVGLSIIHLSAKIIRDLYDRSSRRLLCAPKSWLIDDLMDNEIRHCKTYEDYCDILNHPVLRVCPFFLSFKLRLKLFERLTTTNRESIQGRNDGHSFRPGIHIHIMRGRLIEDGLAHLNKLGTDLRKRLIVQYVNSAGVTETGLDAGGLFKEFWTDLSNQSFDPNWALFRETEEGFLYPNPSSRAAHGSDDVILYEFLGRILGKAIYENITIKPQFAHFFLSFLRGDYNFLHMIPDLSTMDRTLYHNLMFLKTYDGDAKDLCLTFAVAKDDFGCNEQIPLLPEGENLDVTNYNKHRYIGMVAKYYVYDRVREQSEAFRRGLWDVIEKKWLQIFNEPELQVVISGSMDGTVDVEDMKANTKLVGGYTIFDKSINRFWRVVKSFNNQQRSQLLRFVTSCERPPPLGFSSMNPPFTIQRVPLMSDDQLPTASTCFNILKLPPYSSEKVLRDRLLYSIQSGCGFELT